MNGKVLKMTITQKQNIVDMRQQSIAFSQIAEALDMNINTVKAFYRRNDVFFRDFDDTKDKTLCKQCGKRLKQIPKTKPKTFCCDKCRFAFWNKQKNQKHRASLHRLVCTYCGGIFGSHDKHRKYCQHACYIEHRFGKGNTDVFSAI
jgi:rRNA maturation endonuclease Nob1